MVAVEVAVVKHRSRMLVTVAVVMSFCCLERVILLCFVSGGACVEMLFGWKIVG